MVLFCQYYHIAQILVLLLHFTQYGRFIFCPPTSPEVAVALALVVVVVVVEDDDDEEEEDPPFLAGKFENSSFSNISFLHCEQLEYMTTLDFPNFDIYSSSECITISFAYENNSSLFKMSIYAKYASRTLVGGIFTAVKT